MDFPFIFLIICSHMFQLVAVLLDLACCETWFRLTGIGIRSRLLAVDLAAKRSAAVDRAVSQAIATSVTRKKADESYTLYLYIISIISYHIIPGIIYIYIHMICVVLYIMYNNNNIYIYTIYNIVFIYYIT